MSIEIIFRSPENHYEIAKSLLFGRFIIHGEPFFDEVIKNFDYYLDFFHHTYRCQLERKSEVVYLSSQNAKENYSKDIMIVLAVMIYEINLQGKNIYEELMSPFTIGQVREMIQNSSYSRVCRSVDLDSFFQKCKRRNLITARSNETIRFTSAINIFLEHARKIQEIDTI
ncbi:MAG: hypothetical protein GX780_01600 [Campylobacteraceae bacterium]|nr:hypothetical protein [Campylobacteraceae bacterium]